MARADILVIAHRGASAHAPENTYAAFECALAMGATHLELDLHCSRDGDLVVIHDADLERTTTGTGQVDELSTLELCALDCGRWFGPAFESERIPLFDDVLERYRGRAHLHVEIKGRTNDISQKFIESVVRSGWVENLTMTSFQIQRIREVRDLAPAIKTGWLVKRITVDIIEQAKALDIAQVNPKAEYLRAEQVVLLHELGFIVRAWGVKDEALMRKMVSLGVDGMTVNFPDKLLAYLRTV